MTFLTTLTTFPQLSEWAEGHLLAIFNAYLYSPSPDQAFEHAWTDFFSPNATLMVNGREVTLDDAKKMMLSILKAYGRQRVVVRFTSAVHVGKSTEDDLAGCVSLIYQLLVDGEVVSTNSLHLFIDQDHSLKRPDMLQSNIKGGFDTRRVFKLNEIVAF